MLAPKTPAPAAPMLSIPISSYHSATTIVQLPLAFVRSGIAHIHTGIVSYTGSNGYIWSRTTKSNAYAYYLGFSSSAINFSGSEDRWLGFPLRCLYLGKFQLVHHVQVQSHLNRDSLVFYNP